LADLLAIISHDRADPVAESSLDRLIASYEAARGSAPDRETVAADGVRACALRRTPSASGGVERGSDGWTAWAGSIVPQPSAMTAPLRGLDGQFALVRSQEGGRTVVLASDPLGMKPLFTASSGRATLVSTSALALARHLRATPSRLGLESFLRSGLQFGRATQWEGIERMQPAEYLRFSDGARTSGTYWQPELEEEVGRLSLQDAVQLCVERASGALAGRYGDGGRPWLDLTGGFDSRLLALLARRAGIDFIANTVGEESDEDVKLANRVAARAGWPWTQFPLPGDWTEQLPGFAEQAVGWGDGHLDALSLSAVLLAHEQKAAAETTLLNGGGGEEFRDHPWGHELFAAGRSTSVNYERLLAWRILLPVDISALRRDPTPAVTDAFREELERRAKPFASQPNTFQGDVLYALKMTGHSGAYQAAAGASIDLEVPFYLKPVLLTVISVARRHRRFHRLMRGMMRELDPAIAAIQTETGGPAEPPTLRNLHRFAPYGWRRGQRFAMRVRGRLPSAAEPRDLATPPQPQAAQAALIGALDDAGRLDPARMRSASLYDAERLTELLARAVSHPQSVDWDAVGRIVTVEMALELADAGLD
jgi:hypothetical protein